MFSLALSVALFAQTPNAELFRREVQARAQEFDTELPEVSVVHLDHPTRDRWAWTYRICQDAGQTDCAPAIYVRDDVLAFFSYDVIRMLAMHEMIHVRNRDWIPGSVWDRSDPEAMRMQESEHRRIMREVVADFDDTALQIARAQVEAWNRRFRGQR